MGVAGGMKRAAGYIHEVPQVQPLRRGRWVIQALSFVAARVQGMESQETSSTEESISRLWDQRDIAT